MEILYFLFLAHIIVVVQPVVLNVTSHELLHDLLSKFGTNPTDWRYRQPVPLGENNEYQVFIWSPLEQFELSLSCPTHNLLLKPSSWTSNLITPNSNYNPRLIYDLFCNLLLVQRFYSCPFRHSFLSCSSIMMNLLDDKVIKKFPYKKYHQTVFSNRIIDYVFDQLIHGNNFNQITESISNLHFLEYQRSHDANLEGFYENVMYSFPGRDKILSTFLDIFQDRRSLYVKGVEECVPAVCISADHTFKIAKNIGGYREEDDSWVNENRKVFIVMDEKHRVCGWKVTKTVGHAEIQPILNSIHQRMSNNTTLLYAIVDNCCESKDLYQSVFPGIDVKLDLFHAIKRLTSNIPKLMSGRKAFCNNLGLIIRQKDDIGNIRTKPTEGADNILSNLDNFISNHKEFITNLPEKKRKQFYAEVLKLKKHIQKGCLTGIMPGHGTEANENIHSLLNRSCLVGASTISPELVLAILTVLFYSYNKKIDGKKHICNSKVIPIRPIDTVIAKSINTSPEVKSDIDVHDVLEISDFSADTVLLKIMQKILNNLTTFKEIEQICSKRMFQMETLLNKGQYISVFDSNTIDELEHTETLRSNCLAFGLEMTSILKDGDCLFASILQQVHSVSGDKNWEEHIQSLNLYQHDDKTLILNLRKMFVDEVTTNHKYAGFIVNGDDVTPFLNHGVFAHNFGDLVISACSNILRVPIFVISSIKDMSAVTFFPDLQIRNNPLMIAFNAFECHYNGTAKYRNKADETGLNGQEICKCSTSYGNPSCSSISKYSSRCPCLKMGKNCSSNCKCTNCANSKEPMKKPVTGCRCGEAMKGGTTSCVNVQGKRATKCKCFRSKNPCGKLCFCKGCKNEYGARQCIMKSEATSSRKSQTIPSYKRKRTTAFLKENDDELSHGKWTFVETLSLWNCYHLVVQANLLPSVENIHTLYNLVYNAQTDFVGLKLRPKSINSIHFKLINLSLI